MKEKNDFALVPRPPGSLEKSAPGAKRILSGMVADTLALSSARIKAEAESWYENGVSCYVAQNYPEAVKWYRKAADRGIAGAQFSLGVCYDFGDGVTQDHAEAVKWYRRAADQGNAGAQNNLGNCYRDGQGVVQDQAEAIKWYRKAADQDEARAQNSLAWCYVDSNKSEHLKWLRKAAEQGHEKAQARLRIILWMGSYLPEEQQDIVEAYKWERVRAEKEFDGIIHSNIKEFITPEQIQKGEALAHEYLSKATRQQNN